MGGDDSLPSGSGSSDTRESDIHPGIYVATFLLKDLKIPPSGQKRTEILENMSRLVLEIDNDIWARIRTVLETIQGLENDATSR